MLNRIKIMCREKSVDAKDCYLLLKRGLRFLNFANPTIPKGVLKVMIGLTYRCQCSCPYCGCAIYDRSRAELAYNDFKKIIEDISRLPYVFICVSFFGGEPLLGEHLFRLVELTRRKGMLCEVDSNGLLLSRANVKRLKDAGLHHIFVSIDNTVAGEHDKIKGMEGCHVAAMQGIENCLKAGLSCSISTYASRSNILTGELRKIVELGRRLKVKSVRILPPAAVKAWKEEEGAETLRREDTESVRKLLTPGFVYLESTQCNSASSRKGCAASGKQFFYISPYGDMQPCPYFPVSFGSVLMESVPSILKKMHDVRMINKDKDINCLVNDPAIRTHFTGNSVPCVFPVNYGY